MEIIYNFSINKMTSPHYTFSKTGVSTNQSDLKAFQKKLLKQSYEQQMQPKRLKASLYQLSSNNYSNNNKDYAAHNQNPQTILDLNLANSKQRPENTIIRNSWAQQLDAQIQEKELRKKIDRQSQIKRQKLYVQSNQYLFDEEIQKQKQFKKQFQQQAQQNYCMKQQRKKKEKVVSNQEREYYKKRYSLNNLHSGIGYYSSQSPNPTRDYYNSLAQMKKQQEKIPVQENKSKQPGQRQYQIDRIGQIEDLNHINFSKIQNAFLAQQKKEAQLHKSHLKEALLQQIKTQKQKKVCERVKDFYDPYTNAQLKNVDNPIYNPIDVKIAKDNPYIMKQLMSKSKVPKSDSDQKQNLVKGSYLSRQGSSSLLR